MALLVTIVGWLGATQIYNPSKRVIEGVAGFVLASILWSYSTLGAVWFLALMYPFPFAIYLGNSNFIFALLIFIIYLVRVSTGAATIRFDRQITFPVLLLVTAYIFSFYNTDYSSVLFKYGLVHTGNFFAALFFMYMIINLVDDEEKLEKTVRIMAISATLVIAFTFFEMLFPGRVIIPNWLYTPHKTELIMKNIRMGGPFHDFELVAEFFAMHVLIFFFLYARSKRLITKSFYMALLVIDLMMMFTTITRGAFISLFIGVTYLMFLSRRDLDFVKLVMIVGAFALMILILEYFVAQYTTSGSLFERLFMTTFEKGVIPYNRVDAWGGAIERGMKHPFIGNGPGWDFSGGLNVGMWPHNVYLFYFNVAGLFGLSAFLLILYRLGKASIPGIKSSLVNSPFPEAFMKVLHVCFVMFCIDQIKIEYIRNDKYVFFIWIFFGLIIATSNIIRNNRENPGSFLDSRSEHTPHL
jgi:hypothetical protein